MIHRMFRKRQLSFQVCHSCFKTLGSVFKGQLAKQLLPAPCAVNQLFGLLLIFQVLDVAFLQALVYLHA